LLALSAFFSAAESALFSLSRLRLALLAREATAQARAIVATMREPNAALVTILVGNNFANLGGSAFATAVALRLFGENGVAIAVPVMTLLILFVTEAGPKTIAIRHPETVSRAIIGPLRFFEVLFAPFRFALTWFLAVVMRFISRRAGAVEESVALGRTGSAAALFKAAVDFGHEEGIIAPFEKEIFDNVTEVHDLIVREIMTPRTEIIALPASTRVDEARRFATAKRVSRIPLYSGRFENLIGLLHVSDLLGAADATSVRSLAKPLYYVPETKPVVELLLEFKARGVHFAVAVEESGGIAGVATLEDILEEIVGDIRDERHLANSRFVRRSDASIVVSARIDIDTFQEVFGVELDYQDADTLGGYVLAKIGRIPQAGEVLFLGDLMVYVRRAEPNRIVELEVTRLAPSAGAAP
jgi:CBS domain containing-hemolysin-like protein